MEPKPGQGNGGLAGGGWRRRFAVLTGCLDEERTVEGFCSELVRQQDRLSAKYNERADTLGEMDDGTLQVVGALATTLEAQGDLVAYMRSLHDAAPDEIRADVGVVRDAFEAQQQAAADAVGDPLGSLANLLVGGFQAAGPLERVSEFARENCGRNI